MKGRLFVVGIFIIVVFGTGFLTNLADTARKTSLPTAPVGVINVVPDHNFVNLPVSAGEDGYIQGYADGYGKAVRETEKNTRSLMEMVMSLRAELAQCLRGYEEPPSDPFPPALEAGWNH